MATSLSRSASGAILREPMSGSSPSSWATQNGRLFTSRASAASEFAHCRRPMLV
ncbi:Uncharacterised protein [Mycobacteroides abscessus subsp. abscessus]|nr:Uncharacterised protein [Mycobacteroides abscessus subsp. abscessus]